MRILSPRPEKNSQLNKQSTYILAIYINEIEMNNVNKTFLGV